MDQNMNILQLPEFEIVFLEEKEGLTYYHVKPVNDNEKVFCPTCGKPCVGNGAPERMVRDMPLFGKPIALLISANRYLCKSCGRSYPSFFECVDDRARITTRLREHIAKRCLIEPVSKLAEDNYISVATVSRITKETIKTLENNWKFYTPSILGLFTILIGGKKRILCVDVENNGIVELLEDADANTLESYFTKKIDKSRVKSIVMEFDKTHRSVIKRCFPTTKLICNYRHVVELIRNALIAELGRVRAKTYLSLVVKKKAELNETEKANLNDALKRNAGLRSIYDAKELLYDFLECEDSQSARNCLTKAYDISPNCKHLRRAVEQIEDFFDEVQTGYDTSYNRDCAQKVVDLTRKLEKRGAGFKFSTLRARLLFAPEKKTAKAKKIKYSPGPSGSYGFMTSGHLIDYEEYDLGNYVSIDDVLNMWPSIVEAEDKSF